MSNPIKFPAPASLPKTRHVMITRPVQPKVEGMLGDLYEIISSQLHQLKLRAILQELSASDAAKMHRYALTLTLLRQEEDKRTEKLRLSDYSDAELERLAANSKRLLGSGDDIDADKDE